MDVENKKCLLCIYWMCVCVETKDTKPWVIHFFFVEFDFIFFINFSLFLFFFNKGCNPNKYITEPNWCDVSSVSNKFQLLLLLNVCLLLFNQKLLIKRKKKSMYYIIFQSTAATKMTVESQIVFFFIHI